MPIPGATRVGRKTWAAVRVPEMAAAAAALLGASCCLSSRGEGGSASTGAAVGGSTGGGIGASSGSGGASAGATSGGAGGTAASSGSGGAAASSGASAGGSSGAAATSGGASGSCALTLGQSDLFFGDVQLGIAASQVLTLGNDGTAECQISQIAIGSGSDPSFALASGQGLAEVVMVGGSASISVTMMITSETGPAKRTGTLSFATNDPANPTVSVPLTGLVEQDSETPGWPQWRHDSANTGFANEDSSAMHGVVAWESSIGVPGAGTTWTSSPVIDLENTTYVLGLLSGGDGLYAIGDDGTQHWSILLDDAQTNPLPSTPSLLTGGLITLLAQAGGPNLFYTSDSGIAISGLAYTGGFFASRPNADAQGRIFCASAPESVPGTGSFSALVYATSSGAPELAASLSLPFATISQTASVALDQNDDSYWAGDGQVVAIGPPFLAFQPESSWPAGGVTVATAAGSVGGVVSQVAYDPYAGRVVVASSWEAEAAGLYSVQTSISALDPTSGTIEWTTALPAASIPADLAALPSAAGNSAPAIGPDGTIYVGTGAGLAALDGSTGSTTWTFASANVTSSAAVAADGSIFFGAEDGTFYALSSSGTERFAISTAGPISSEPAITSENSVVFVSDDGNLYFLE